MSLCNAIYTIITNTSKWIYIYSLAVATLVVLLPHALPEPDPSLKLENISFTPDINIASSKQSKKPVRLPHDWGKDGIRSGTVWYQAPVIITENTHDLALYIRNVQQIADIWIDDLPVNANLQGYTVNGRIWSKPLFVELPEYLVSPGEHKINIYLHSTPPRNGLLGHVYLGPAHLLRPVWEWHYHYRFTLVAIITFSMLSLSLLIGCIWLLRKQDTLYAWFTACSFFWSLHNVPHLINAPRNVKLEVWDGFYFSTLGWMVTALIIFNHRFLGKTYKKREIIFVIFAVLLSLPLFALPTGLAHLYAFYFWDPLLLPMGAYSILFLIYMYSKRSLHEIKLMILVGITILAFGANDYLVLSGQIDRTRGLLIQFSALPAMLVIIWFLLSRFNRALVESELLNLELEQRVKNKEIEIKENYGRLKRMEREQLLVEERSRIMQDVHDGVGGQLVAMLAEIESGGASTEHIKETLSRSLTDLRLVIDSLDTASEDLPTLLGMLRTRLQPSLDSCNIKLQWRVTSLPVLKDFGPRKALQLMRILQEAIANVIKHSRAVNLYVTTEVKSARKGQKKILIEIRDDGSWVEAGDQTRRGLNNMNNRAKNIGAEIQISGNNHGTSVQVILTSEENPQNDRD